MASVAHEHEQDDQVTPLVTLVALLGVLIWSYGNSLLTASSFWDNPKYSHGWLVPLFTLVLLFIRREPFGAVTSSARWAGVGLIATGVGVRLLCTYFPNITPDMASFVPCALGVFLLVGGWRALRWAGPPVAFLIFMFPLPRVFDANLLNPLQRLATVTSTYALQTLGIPCFHESNMISLGVGELPLTVVEQCSGLRMLTIFVALSVAMTMVTDRPIWERIVIVASAVPIALLVNVIRITVTGVLHLTVGTEIANKVFHDLAGWVMMPLAFGLLYVEFQILSHLMIEEGPVGPLPIGVGPPRRTEKAVV